MGRPKVSHCPQGHEYTAENTYERGNGKRECRICRREKKRANAAPKLAQGTEIRKSSTSLVEGTNVKATDAEVERALLVLAKHSGNCAKAGRELGLDGGRLGQWRRIFHERYLEIVEEEAPKIRTAVFESQVAIAQRAGEVELKALDLTEATLDELDARDRAGAARNIATIKGIALTQANNYATPVPQARDSDDVNAILEGLRRLGVAKPIEAEAEEIKDAEVIPDP